jgi:hypothetical protein
MYYVISILKVSGHIKTCNRLAKPEKWKYREGHTYLYGKTKTGWLDLKKWLTHLMDQAMSETQKICFKCTHSVLERYPWSTKERHKIFKSLAVCVFV